MVFSDPLFLFFFLPISLLTLSWLRGNIFLITLFVLSLVFYFWGSQSIILVLIFYAVFNWLISFYVHKKTILISGLMINFSILFVFKYLGFVSFNVEQVAGIVFPNAAKNIILPIGISFYAFQSASYLIDVYRGDVRPSRNPLLYFAYLCFFPQLIAGPIIRYTDVYADYIKPKRSINNAYEGSLRFIHGIGKKVIVADTCGRLADIVFSLPQDQMTFATAWLGALAYSLQIYFDFSGYSDMAIGIGLIIGIRFKENFDRPYSASTVTEFWRRWHISLSSWFKDYLYIPLGGNRGSKWSVYRNLVIVFLVTGIWHGAAWTFILWGIMHGILLIIERLLFGRSVLEITSSLFRVFYLLPMIILSWVLFRSESVPQFIYFTQHMFNPVGLDLSLAAPLRQSMTWITVALLIFSSLVFIIPRNLTARKWIHNNGTLGQEFLKASYGIIVILMSVMLILVSDYSPFLYFQF